MFPGIKLDLAWPVNVSPFILPRLRRPRAPKRAIMVSYTDCELRAHYDAYLAYVLRREASTTSDTESDGWFYIRVDFPDFMWAMRGYLEFIIQIRNCAAERERHDPPLFECSRLVPCRNCKQHSGAYVGGVEWHFVGNDDVERNLAEYLRIRPHLPPYAHEVQLAPVSPDDTHVADSTPDEDLEHEVAEYLRIRLQLPPYGEDAQLAPADIDRMLELEKRALEMSSPQQEY
ncbi:hypothetical protein AURDEDRAFT_172346 [Auricularia subglabra TFB-10046 SS5]|nr:hypothetical protein AURDEDRAFT_172346 [Auricularia subglabra TFB-10046 SS5]